MKTRLIAIIVAAGISLFFVSCKKEQADTNSQEQTVIRSALMLNPNRPPGYDTTAKYYFDYDGLKRVSFASEVYFNDNDNKPLYMKEIRLHYLNGDSLPFKLSIVSYLFTTQPAQVYYDTAYLTYNNDFIIKDSSVTARPFGVFSRDVIDFTKSDVDNSYWISVKQMDFDGHVFYRYRKSVPEWQNGNLMHEVDSGNHEGGGGPGYTDHRFIYDHHKNPFRKLLFVFPAYHFLHEINLTSTGFYYLSNFPASENNVMRWENNKGGFNYTCDWSYEYNSEGLPVKAIANGGSRSAVTTYNYISR